jgi:hypothetical protein
MIDSKLEELVQCAEALYASKLKASLEPDHLNEFVAIEPISGEYFLGSTFSEALGSAREAFPDRLAHTMRVGHAAAIHFGMQTR